MASLDTSFQSPIPKLPPLVVIVGPTASGKSALAHKLAQKIGGEIIAADSRTVYKGMDVGTAKPSKQEQTEVRYHLLDVVEPGERFTAADFQALARAAIADIWRRGHYPIMVGGTGLYIDGVLFEYAFGPDVDVALRAKLNKMTAEKLHNYCILHNIELPRNAQNKRHLIRAIQLGGINRKRNQQLRDSTIVVGITAKSEVLQKRISTRAKQMFASSVVEETKTLAAQYGWEGEAMTGNIYRIVRRLLNREITEREAIELFITSDLKLAKRQMTWFKRNPHIVWSEDPRALLNKIIIFAQKQYPPGH